MSGSKVEYTPKTVIENKLLAALDPGSPSVAIILTSDELDLLIDAVALLADIEGRGESFLKDMRKLRAGAFPEAKAKR